MTTPILDVPKNRGGRPPKDKKGKNVWVPAEVLDAVLMLVASAKAKAQKTNHAAHINKPS